MELSNFNQLRKKAKAEADASWKHIKLAILGDNATQFAGMAIKGYGHEKKLNIEIYEAEYNQIEPEIINPGSELYEFEPDFILLFYSSEELYSSFMKKPTEEKEQFASNHIASIKDYLAIVKERLRSKIIIVNHPVMPDEVYGNFALKVTASFRYQLATINYHLLSLAQERGATFICDMEAMQSYLGYSNRIDQRFYSQSSMVLSVDYLPYFAKSIVDIIGANAGTILKKCLILDLDNTTWGGVIGDDGIDKILIGNIKGGKPFTQLQYWAKELKKRGIILCVCSKNTDSVAREPFEKHPDMVLRLDDISVFVANWENKADNIRHIQSVLNIGFDSMVFIDDNPFERNLVKTELPEVTVPDLPKDPAHYMSYLRGLNLFETATVSKEDASRTKRYQEEATRLASKARYQSIDGYLESLEMRAEIIPFSKFSIPRIAQLTQRSNQFNLRTIRYTEDEITALIDSPNHITLQLRLFDKFGDYGIVSLIIGEIQKETNLFIDSWIMSCRVLKRGVERFVLDEIIAAARERGLSTIIGEYLPTVKNKLVKDHYENLGFEPEGAYWILDVASYKPTSKYIAKEPQKDLEEV